MNTFIYNHKKTEIFNSSIIDMIYIKKTADKKDMIYECWLINNQTHFIYFLRSDVRLFLKRYIIGMKLK